MSSLSIGSTGDSVVALQRALIAKGLLSGSADGRFGPKTLAAVEQFQRQSGLTTDGKVGPQTAARLGMQDSFESAGTQGSQSVSGITVTPSMRRFADIARRNAENLDTRGRCAYGVNTSIEKAFGFRNYGNGNEVDDNLPRSKFKQLNISLAEALKIPGLVLTWERTSTTAGQKYGHTAITLGNGRSSASDFVEQNTLGVGGRSGFKVFMPLI